MIAGARRLLGFAANRLGRAARGIRSGLLAAALALACPPAQAVLDVALPPAGIPGAPNVTPSETGRAPAGERAQLEKWLARIQETGDTYPGQLIVEAADRRLRATLVYPSENGDRYRILEYGPHDVERAVSNESSCPLSGVVLNRVADWFFGARADDSARNPIVTLRMPARGERRSVGIRLPRRNPR